MTNVVQIAEKIARSAHHGQTRRDKVTPYVTHLQETYRRVLSKYPDDVVALATSWLHDTVEDTEVRFPFRLKELLITNGVDDETASKITDAVNAMTKTKAKTYKQYLHDVKRNDVAKRVKVEDMLSNLADSPTDDQIVKYAGALTFLMKEKSVD